jgi:hypothetical protein
MIFKCAIYIMRRTRTRQTQPLLVALARKSRWESNVRRLVFTNAKGCFRCVLAMHALNMPEKPRLRAASFPWPPLD